MLTTNTRDESHMDSTAEQIHRDLASRNHSPALTNDGRLSADATHTTPPLFVDSDTSSTVESSVSTEHVSSGDGEVVIHIDLLPLDNPLRHMGSPLSDGVTHADERDHAAPTLVRIFSACVGLTPQLFMLLAEPILWTLILLTAQTSIFNFFMIPIVVATTAAMIFHFLYPTMPTASIDNGLDQMASIIASPNVYHICGLNVPVTPKRVTPLNLSAKEYAAVMLGMSMEWVRRAPLLYPGFSALLPANIKVFQGLRRESPLFWLTTFGSMAGYLLVGISVMSQLARLLISNTALPVITDVGKAMVAGTTHADAFMKRALLSVLPEAVVRALHPADDRRSSGFSYHVIQGALMTLSALEPIASHLLPPMAVLTRYAAEWDLHEGDPGYMYVIYVAEVGILLSITSLIAKVCVAPKLPTRGYVGEVLTSLGFPVARFVAYSHLGIDMVGRVLEKEVEKQTADRQSVAHETTPLRDTVTSNYRGADTTTSAFFKPNIETGCLSTPCTIFLNMPGV